VAEAILWVLGVPLSEQSDLPAQTLERIAQADIVIGESRKSSFRFLAQVPGGKQKPLFLTDESARPEEKDWLPAVKALAKTGGSVALFSDTGMPLLFDPGRDVLIECRKLGFKVRSVSAATSWGSACALTGWDPPFCVAGFPPREKQDRDTFWKTLRQSPQHCVIMERPYRFLALLGECREIFGKTRPAFLAWELDSPEEVLIWGTLEELEKRAGAFTKSKGEFVVVVKGISLQQTPDPRGHSSSRSGR
jgi:16S rRNA (cytidine1402-2'-O)-methyltransferase